VEAMREAQEKGITVCLASGRSLATILPFQREAGIEGPIVSCNGAYVVDANGREVFSRSVSREGCRFLLSLASSRGIQANIYCREAMHLTQVTEFAEEYFRRTGLPPTANLGSFPPDGEPSKILFMDTPEVISALHDELAGSLDPGFASMVRSEKDYLEFLPTGVSKGLGLSVLAGSLGIGAAETAALGDYWNDLEMIEWAGFSGAMSGAPEELQLKADVTVSSNDQGGAAEFIRLVLSQSGLD
jgi:Cof subfamily protein (haloacid dehalogenase superfamily)